MIIMQGVANTILDHNRCQAQFYESIMSDEERKNDLKNRMKQSYAEKAPQIKQAEDEYNQHMRDATQNIPRFGVDKFDNRRENA